MKMVYSLLNTETGSFVRGAWVAAIVIARTKAKRETCVAKRKQRIKERYHWHRYAHKVLCVDEPLVTITPQPLFLNCY